MSGSIGVRVGPAGSTVWRDRPCARPRSASAWFECWRCDCACPGSRRRSCRYWCGTGAGWRGGRRTTRRSACGCRRASGCVLTGDGEVTRIERRVIENRHQVAAIAGARTLAEVADGAAFHAVADAAVDQQGVARAVGGAGFVDASAGRRSGAHRRGQLGGGALEAFKSAR